VKQIIAVEAMKEGFRANLFETFEQAVGFFDLEHGSAPPTSRSLRSPVGAVGAPSLRGLRSPISPGAEAPSSRSLPPRQVFKSVASKAAAQPTSEEPTNPGSRRPQRITIR
jgi:hypothetical protein